MMEKSFANQKLKEFMIEEFITHSLKGVGLSSAKLQKTPLGEKIIIYSSRPGLVVGRKGKNITLLTKTLKEEFGLENPQIEIAEIANPDLDPKVIAEKISNSLERFGSARFKGIGHRVLSDVIKQGAMGIEILISGKIPGSRSKTWRFYQGYLKKCGDTAITAVLSGESRANLKTGVVGIKVKIMPPGTRLPDDVILYENKVEEIPTVDNKEKQTEKSEKQTKEKVEKKTAKKTTKKKAVKKTTTKKVEKSEEVKDEK